MKKEEKEKPRYGLLNFERRKHPRFNVDFPIEYGRTDLFVKRGDAANASEGGLLLYLPEEMEIGEHLSLKLFFPSDDKLESIHLLVEVAWIDIHLGKERRDYRTGVKVVDISLEDLDKLKNFLKNLAG